jgi:pyridoxamine 5'-phosphate oxidase
MSGFADAPDTPHPLFERWFAEAQGLGVEQPETVALASVSADGQPSVRFVLFKGLDDTGAFTFFTNYGSRKARELDEVPHAALAFYWHRQERQVRIEGSVQRCSAEASDAYFETRPRGSQLGAWASEQSRPRAAGALEARLAELEARFENRAIPRPPHWGGYEIRARAIEFWQGQPSRLHDRLLYTFDPSGWTQQILFP